MKSGAALSEPMLFSSRLGAFSTLYLAYIDGGEDSGVLSSD